MLGFHRKTSCLLMLAILSQIPSAVLFIKSMLNFAMITTSVKRRVLCIVIFNSVLEALSEEALSSFHQEWLTWRLALDGEIHPTIIFRSDDLLFLISSRKFSSPLTFSELKFFGLRLCLMWNESRSASMFIHLMSLYGHSHSTFLSSLFCSSQLNFFVPLHPRPILIISTMVRKSTHSGIKNCRQCLKVSFDLWCWEHASFLIRLIKKQWRHLQIPSNLNIISILHVPLVELLYFIFF